MKVRGKKSSILLYSWLELSIKIWRLGIFSGSKSGEIGPFFLLMKNPLVDRSKSYFSGRNLAKTRQQKKTMPGKEGCCCGWVRGNFFVFTFVTFLLT
jgi:hypothetical protein